jgi:hypothetical protein
MTAHASDADLRTLVEECDDISRCEECGTHVVNLGTHRCPSEGGGRPAGRSARQRRASHDTRDDDDEVGVFRRAHGNTYAYHELDDGDVYCGCSKYTKAGQFDIIARSEAKALGRSPCGNCRRLRAFRDGE